jgi:hypothetical protein
MNGIRYHSDAIDFTTLGGCNAPLRSCDIEKADPENRARRRNQHKEHYRADAGIGKNKPVTSAAIVSAAIDPITGNACVMPPAC